MKNRDHHTFLDYTHAEVHFVYGFIWESAAQIRPEVFRHGVLKRDDGWKTPLVHERVIGDLESNGVERKWVGAYQPTFELEKRCLEKSGNLAPEEGEASQLALVVPIANGINLPLKGDKVDLFIRRGAKKELVSCPVLGKWTLRLFDTGAGTFTVRICLRDFGRLTGQKRFCRIQWLLRLVPNMDNAPEGHPGTALQQDGPIADSFLFALNLGTCRLFDVMRHLRDRTLDDVPRSFFDGSKPEDKPCIKADDSILVHGPVTKKFGRQLTPFMKYPAGNWYENQTPFTFVTSVVGKRDLRRLKRASPMTAKEIASIYARLTLDNRSAHQDFSLLTEDYMRRALDIEDSPFRIRNVSHDERLFVAFSKRGAIALTCDPDKLPSVFVIPSILNLFELMRARLFTAVAVGAKLTEFASHIARPEPASSEQIDFKTYLQLRKLVVLNLNDPLQYLFDGGSTTELATAADRALAVSKAWNRVRRTFDVVDHLMKTWELVRFRKTMEE